MRKLYLYAFIFLFFNCQKDENRCGQIIQKVTQGSSYYFVLQTDDYLRSYGDPDLPGIPDDGIRQGSVTKEIYDQFNVGDDYCSED